MKHAILKIIALTLCTSFSAAMAVTLGETVINDPILGMRTIVFANIDNYALVEGDILMGRADELSAKSASILPKLSGARWPNGIMPFELSEDLPWMNKLAVLQAMDILQKNTNIEFVELTSKNRENYSDYLFFIPAKGTTCASAVGKQGGKQDILLAPRCNTMNSVHEIGHALGLWHEQSRHDRDSYVKIIWENIEPGYRYNFNQHLTDSRDYGDYDYQSIMHYPAYAFSINGQKTIIPLREDITIGQRDHLSEKDIIAINAMYPAA